LSWVLRHEPERIGLELDPGGWAEIDALLAAANVAGVRLDEATLHKVIAQSDKQRFAVSEDGTRIRASHGHSIPVDLDLAPLAPPARLYHGTATRFLASIRDRGLRPKERNHVHLSVDRATALQVGQRHGRPVVLTVQAGQMHEERYAFYRSASGIWLTEHVPTRYIVFPEGSQPAG
jgi:putative RNA 2'-phosphotransferase